jgi:excinuclease ABC subunit A
LVFTQSASTERGVTQRSISLRGVSVHNLKDVDLDIPHRKLVVICGLSGSGKSSLALDTLYAEGQRRYIDSFSAYTRQFLDRLEKPDAERIDGIPPAIAVTHKSATRSNRSTLATATEIADYLRLLFARIGRVFCLKCDQPVVSHTPQSIAEAISGLPDQTRLMLTFGRSPASDTSPKDFWTELREAGLVRVIADGRLLNLGDGLPETLPDQLQIVADRLTAGATSTQRLRDSLEGAFLFGSGQISIFSNSPWPDSKGSSRPTEIDGQPWYQRVFSASLRCDACGLEYPPPEPRLFSFNSPLGACPKCEGFGNVVDIDMDLIVPDKNLSIRAGAIAPWNTPAYAHERDELLQLAGDYQIPVDEPFKNLTPAQLKLIRNGVPERQFGGLRGFFKWLERRKYKMHIRVFLSRWRSYRVCPACNGTRLKPEALAARVGGRNIGEISQLQVEGVAAWCRSLSLAETERQLAHTMLAQIAARLDFLASVGLGYLTLDRPLRTLSDGEAARVALTAALGSSLVNLLYVLDEPSVGLHPGDVDRLVQAIRALRDRGNSVVVVEHEEAMIRAADRVIEIGPGAGERGGQVIFQGTPEELVADERSLTGDFLAGRRGVTTNAARREPSRGWIRLTGARGNNLQNLTIEFPLGVLCLVTGVSGAGKSTLIEETLYPAVCKRLKRDSLPAAAYDDLYGDGQLEDVVMVDQAPIGRSPRSNPVTYIKAFDEIREAFAETVDARTRNITASHFSFNVDGGRCTACEGDGYLQIDMQFLADVFIRCPQCHGARYRPEILAIKYRGRNIAEVLDLTVREAFTFFRGRPKLQSRLKRLIDVGLDYLRLGQPANTLSGGESQRLKLAHYMAQSRKGKTLFLLDEPTTGLHFQDVIQLLDCFDALLAVGHSLIVVEHNLQLMKAADYLIDLGPGAGECGGQIVAEGTPEEVMAIAESVTGRYLKAALAVPNNLPT